MSQGRVKSSRWPQWEKISRWLLVVVLLIAAFSRLYRLPETIQFLGDQGRDAILVSRVWRHYDLPFIGPVTSIGNVYLGPLYYYYMVPWLWLSYPSPVGPAYGVALLSILTVYLTYKWGKELVGQWPALLAALMMAVSNSAVVFGRFSWNPNPEPFASLTLVYAMFKARQDVRWWVVASLAMAILAQLHYMSLLCLPVIGLFWLYQLYQMRSDGQKLKKLGLWSMIAVVLFLLLISPLILFDIKHQGQNLAAFWQMVGPNQSIGHTAGQSWVDKLYISLWETHARSIYLLIAPWWKLSTTWATAVVVSFILALIYLIKKTAWSFGLVILTVTLLISWLGLSFYGHPVYDHYVLYLLPITCLLWSAVLVAVARKSLYSQVIVTLIVLAGVVYNLTLWPIFTTSSPSLTVLKNTAQLVVAQVEPGEKYNIVLLSETKDYYGSNYRYFLTTYLDRQPLIPERDDLNSAQTLIVIDETRLTTDLNSIQQAEIRAFPNKTPEALLEVPDGPRLFVLRRTAEPDIINYSYNDGN